MHTEVTVKAYVGNAVESITACCHVSDGVVEILMALVDGRDIYDHLSMPDVESLYKAVEERVL